MTSKHRFFIVLIGLCLFLPVSLQADPVIIVNPDEIVQELLTGEIEEFSFRITNEGNEDLVFTIEHDIIEEEELIPKLREALAKDPDILLILRVDREAPYISLTELITRCKKAGARNISIGTEQKKVESL